MELAELARAAERKGLDLLGTGDCTHAEWLGEARRRLHPAGDGVYAVGAVRFLITGEVSAVWRDEAKGRRVHLLLLVPSIPLAAEVGKALRQFGTLASDGRPCLAAPVRDIVDAIWAAAPATVVIPAHVWTPWYSALGSRSGFDSLDACFGPYAERITAVETGLSSDPAMCRRVSALDRLSLVSFSDAHSPDRIGREATSIELEEVSFPAVASALRGGRGVRTVELFPEEGKYYHDGHRACGVSLSPAGARSVGNLCPACGRRLTEGVLHRVDDLSHRSAPVGVPTFESAIPLREIVAGVLGLGPQARTVAAAEDRLIARFGPELAILLDRPTDDLRDGVPDALCGVADAIAAVRAGRVTCVPGYDGVYGKVRPNASAIRPEP